VWLPERVLQRTESPAPGDVESGGIFVSGAVTDGMIHPLPLLVQIEGAIALLFFLFVVIVLPLLVFLVHVWLTYWTYTDAKKRGMEDPAVWALLVFFATVPGIVVYLLVRE